MSESREQILQNYYKQFKNNEWAYFLISKLDPKKTVDENISIIINSNIKKAPLKSVISFLKKTFSKKYINAVKAFVVKPHMSKTELAYQILEFVGLSHPYNNDINVESLEEELVVEGRNPENYETQNNTSSSESSSEEERSSRESDYMPESDDSDEDYCPPPYKTTRKNTPSDNTTKETEPTITSNKSIEIVTEDVEYAEEALTSTKRKK